ncbi:MAG: YceI family protein [Chitinophagaceae bacterium]|nr:MAG: YceI family protein [Chitinophagaceae bacterium]
MNTIKRITLTLVSFVLTLSVFAQTSWKSDPNHSKLTFSTVHLGISDVAGLFNSFDATIIANKEDFSDAVFELFVDVKSINTEIEVRDNHLRSEDFFHVEKFPIMTYKSTSIQKVGTDRYKIIGNLALHGVTKEVVMDLWYRGTIENPQSKDITSGFQLTGTLKRSDFNIGPKFPKAMVSDEVKIKADGEFIRQEG